MVMRCPHYPDSLVVSEMVDLKSQDFITFQHPEATPLWGVTGGLMESQNLHTLPALTRSTPPF